MQSQSSSNIQVAIDELSTNSHNQKPLFADKIRASLLGLTSDEITYKCAEIDAMIKIMGISFTVYSDGANIDRQWPLDLVPRLIEKQEWDVTSAGLKQRLKALNMFINDLYNDAKVIKDKIVPEWVVYQSADYRAECKGVKPSFDVWSNICGSDLIRDASGTFRVLEDNLRIPSGVAYMLENRKVIKRTLPELFSHFDVHPLFDYPDKLRQMLISISPNRDHEPNVVLLTPGIFNSAYFEHTFLAQQMGITLVEGADLVVEDDFVYMKTIAGLEKVDVIYRRVDDAYLDPEVFLPESTLGVRGLFNAWRKGNVAIANAPGVGVADDKVLYAFVPELIRYYLSEEPILENIETYLCSDEKQRSYVLNNLDKLVVKPANASGGYGLLIGPHASQQERDECAAKIKADPRGFIAQPTISISTVPTACSGAIEPRHVDLRPFILQGESFYVTRGGLTRVALRKGSLVVNSSQGGGSKDTWVVDSGEYL